jgi:ATP-dependent Clp protease adaptor protein ClpS
MKICDHEYEQAAQCASIVHNSGKCDVKYGDVDTISTMKDKLKSLGLSVTMELISNKRPQIEVFFLDIQIS